MLKNPYFWKKLSKIASASGALPPNTPLPRAAVAPAKPRVVTSAYYYFVEFISIAKCVLLPSK